MDLADLRIFVRASELSSFSKAALALGLAQPSVSRIIGELEAEWDGQLFYRTGRGVTLSELGEQALRKARFLLREAEQATEDIRAFSRSPSGVVSVGLPPSIIENTVPPLFNQLKAELPGIRLQVYEGLSDHIERWLAEGIIDIGAYSKYREGTKIDSTRLLESQLVLAGPSGFTFPKEIEFQKLSEFALVLPARTNGLRVIIDAVARRMKIPLNIIADVDSTNGQKAMAMNCGCFMIKAPHTIALETAQGSVSSSLICNPYITRRVTLVTGNQRPLSRAAREVISRLTGILQAFSGLPSEK